MNHLSPSQLIDLICGEDIADAEEHLASCRQCRLLHQTWIRRIEDLTDLHRETLDEAEIHYLRTMFRHLGPKPSLGTRWLAVLQRASDRPLAAVRGTASGSTLEYAAGPFHILLRVGTPDRRSSVAVYGQLENPEGGDLSGKASFTADDGTTRICDVDRFGEFFLADGSAGRYRVQLWIDGEVVEIDDLHIGLDDTR
jgi:hypothetical protein